MLFFATLSATASATCSVGDAGVSPFSPDDLDPALDIAIMPVDAAAARAAGLHTTSASWASQLDYDGVPSRLAEGGDPTSDDVELADLEARELFGLSGLPVLLARAQDVVFARVEIVSANPTPYPHPVPYLAVAPTRSGFAVDGANSVLTGVAPMSWSVDGIAVDGVAVLVDGTTVVGAIGMPVVEDRGTESEFCDAVLIINPDSM
jgi:hypothetical protein